MGGSFTLPKWRSADIQGTNFRAAIGHFHLSRHRSWVYCARSSSQCMCVNKWNKWSVYISGSIFLYISFLLKNTGNLELQANYPTGCISPPSNFTKGLVNLFKEPRKCPCGKYTDSPTTSYWKVIAWNSMASETGWMLLNFRKGSLDFQILLVPTSSFINRSHISNNSWSAMLVYYIIETYSILLKMKKEKG